MYRGRERPAGNVLKDLRKVWTQCQGYLVKNPPHDREHFLEEIAVIAREDLDCRARG